MQKTKGKYKKSEKINEYKYKKREKLNKNRYKKREILIKNIPKLLIFFQF